jgi:hypothetical protein
MTLTPLHIRTLTLISTRVDWARLGGMNIQKELVELLAFKYIEIDNQRFPDNLNRYYYTLTFKGQIVVAANKVAQ